MIIFMSAGKYIPELEYIDILEIRTTEEYLSTVLQNMCIVHKNKKKCLNGTNPEHFY